MKALATSKHKYFLSRTDSDGIVTVNKVAVGFLGVSECGLFWQGACHLSLYVPCQVTRHRWPLPLWNVPQLAESRQGTFEKIPASPLWRAGRSGLRLLSLANWPLGGMANSANKATCLSSTSSRDILCLRTGGKELKQAHLPIWKVLKSENNGTHCEASHTSWHVPWKWSLRTREGVEITFQVGVLPTATCK